MVFREESYLEDVKDGIDLLDTIFSSDLKNIKIQICHHHHHYYVSPSTKIKTEEFEKRAQQNCVCCKNSFNEEDQR